METSIGSAARIGDKHRGLNFHKAASIEELADLADDLGSLDKGLLGLFIHNEVHISLAVSEICILKAVELLRQRSQGLGQKRQFLGVNGDLAGLGLEDKSLDADNIADIHALEFLVGLLAQIVSGYIDLNAPFLILYVAERSLAHDALEHHAAGDGDSLVLELVKIAFDLRTVVRLIVFYDLKGILSRRLQLREFLSSDLLELGCFLNLLLTFLLVILCHFLPPYYVVASVFHCAHICPKRHL